MGIVQEARFEYKGFPCVVLFRTPGYRCGYVGLPKGTVINTDSIDCHGGITYSNNSLYLPEDNGMFWIGFDCCHSCDDYDVKKAKELFANNKNELELIKTYMNIGYHIGSNFKTLDYVKKECKKIVDQYLEMRDK